MNIFLSILAMVVCLFIAISLGRISAEALGWGKPCLSFWAFLGFIAFMILYGWIYISALEGV